MYQKADYVRAVELVASGKMALDELITHRFSFDHYITSGASHKENSAMLSLKA